MDDITMDGADDVAYVALGSNVGDRLKHLSDARARIANTAELTVLNESAIEETEPLGPVAQPAFLNQMISVRTRLTPPMLLTVLHEIERLGGRVRAERWGPRTIDLDIVKYERTQWSSDDLMVPHTELGNRAFWQRELAQLESLRPVSP